MTAEINNFITFYKQKNGRIKISQSSENEINIYKLLYEKGYRKSILNNKRIYYCRQSNSIIPASFKKIVDVFVKTLEQADYSNIPEEIDKSEIINWFFEKNIIKKNSLHQYHLNEELSTQDKHELLMQIDYNYKHNYEIQSLLKKFEELHFEKTIDNVGSFYRNNPLYYKKIDDKKFMVFNHFNSKDKSNDGFDCWIAVFQNENEIGTKNPISIESIKLGFHISTDLPLIEDKIKRIHV